MMISYSFFLLRFFRQMPRIAFFLFLGVAVVQGFLVLPDAPSTAIKEWIDIHPQWMLLQQEKVPPPPFSVRHEPSRFALDVCCEFGDSTRDLSERLPLGWRVLGLDEDPEKIKKAKERHPFFQFQTGMPEMFPSASFDQIQLSTGRMQYVENKRKMVNELCRILRPGGILEVYDYSPLSLDEDIRNDYNPRFHHSLLEARLDVMNYSIVDQGTIRAIYMK